MSSRITSQPIEKTVNSTIDQVANGAEHAVHSLRERVAPTAVRLATQAEDLAHRSLDVVRERSSLLRERAALAGERSTRYVKDQPVKAVLIAVAAGALIAAVLSLTRSNRDGRSYRD